MKRRVFVSKLLLTGSVLNLRIGRQRKIKKPVDGKAIAPVTPVQSTRKTVTEMERQIPILAETDVLVIGGGPAGTAAAIAANRTGPETYIIELYNHLGGLWTGGLVLPLLSTHAVDKQKNRKQVIFGIGGKIVKQLKELDMSINEINRLVDPEATKYVLEEMIHVAGVKMLYHTWGVPM